MNLSMKDELSSCLSSEVLSCCLCSWYNGIEMERAHMLLILFQFSWNVFVNLCISDQDELAETA